MAEDLRMELKKVEWELEEIDKALTVIYDEIEDNAAPKVLFESLYLIALTIGVAFGGWSILNPGSEIARAGAATCLSIALISTLSVGYMSRVDKETYKLHKRLDIIHARLDRLAKKVEDAATFLSFSDKDSPRLDETETTENYVYKLLQQDGFAEVFGLDWELVQKLIDRGIDMRAFRRACWPRGSILTLDSYGSKFVKRNIEGIIEQLTDEDLDAHDWESYMASEIRFEREIAENRRKA